MRFVRIKTYCFVETVYDYYIREKSELIINPNMISRIEEININDKYVYIYIDNTKIMIKKDDLYNKLDIII